MSRKDEALVMCATGSVIMQALLGDFEGVNPARTAASARRWLAEYEQFKDKLGEAAEQKANRLGATD